jgi:hypothetical protein
MSARNYLAFDLGASSGRAILGRFDGKKLTLEEKHRFTNGPVDVNGRLYWNTLGLYEQLLAGLGKCGGELGSFGIDTWGVDFGIVGAGGTLAAMPVHYRDSRTDGMMELADRLAGNAAIYRDTGIAFMKFNTLYQLLAASRAGELPSAGKLLFMPDLLVWMLTGEAGCEYTIASTSQMLNAAGRTWDAGLLSALGLPPELLLPIQPAGSLRGTLGAAVAREGRGCGRARHRVRRGRRALIQRNLCVSEQRHLVAHGLPLQNARYQRQGAGVELHERGRGRRQLPDTQEHHGPVDTAGMPAGMEAWRPRLKLCEADRPGRRGAGAGGLH